MAMSEAHKKALADGRRRAARVRRAKATKRAKVRVAEYRDWLAQSAAHMARERSLEREGLGTNEIRAKIGPVPRMSDAAAEVTDLDYELLETEEPALD